MFAGDAARECISGGIHGDWAWQNSCLRYRCAENRRRVEERA